MHQDRIKELVYAVGGMHKSRIGKELKLPWGQLSHHLGQLSRRRIIELEYHGQECWAFKPGLLAKDKRLLIASGQPWRRRLIGWLGGRGASTLTELSDELEGSRTVIRHHLGHLMDSGIVKRSTDPIPRYGIDTEPREDSAG